MKKNRRIQKKKRRILKKKWRNTKSLPLIGNSKITNDDDDFSCSSSSAVNDEIIIRYDGKDYSLMTQPEYDLTKS